MFTIDCLKVFKKQNKKAVSAGCRVPAATKFLRLPNAHVYSYNIQTPSPTHFHPVPLLVYTCFSFFLFLFPSRDGLSCRTAGGREMLHMFSPTFFLYSFLFLFFSFFFVHAYTFT